MTVSIAIPYFRGHAPGVNAVEMRRPRFRIPHHIATTQLSQIVEQIDEMG